MLACIEHQFQKAIFTQNAVAVCPVVISWLSHASQVSQAQGVLSVWQTQQKKDSSKSLLCHFHSLFQNVMVSQQGAEVLELRMFADIF